VALANGVIANDLSSLDATGNDQAQPCPALRNIRLRFRPFGSCTFGDDLIFATHILPIHTVLIDNDIADCGHRPIGVRLQALSAIQSSVFDRCGIADCRVSRDV
jgi:hypothetical protein